MSRDDKLSYMNTFGDQIKIKRKELGLTHKDMAKAIGISHVAYGHWERGTNLPNGANLISLAKILKCSPHSLLNTKISPGSRLELEADLIREAYLTSNNEFQAAARRFFDIAASDPSQANQAQK